MNEEEFTSKLMTEIDTEFERIMQTKPADPKEKFLSYADAQALSSHVKDIFNNKMGSVPNQIDGVLKLCEAIMTSTLEEKKGKIKEGLQLLKNVAEITSAIAVILPALGFGTATASAVMGVTVAAPAAGPIAVGVVAAMVAVLAAYFVFSGNDPVKNTEKYMKALKESLQKVMPAVWKEFSEKSSVDPVTLN